MPDTQISAFDPLTVGPLRLRNRFIKAGANEGMCLDGIPSKALVKHHRDLAAGGVAMTTVAYGAVCAEGRTLANQLWLRPDIVPDLRALTEAVHREGAAASIQITHGGSFVTGLHLDRPAMSASGGINKAGVTVGNFFQRAMSEADMESVAALFVRAAELCREAGFDAVELHMGHGYLLNQFISPLSNKRRDRYGGAAEARVRFPAQVLARVKAAVGKDLAVLAKINVTDGVSGGAGVEDAVVTACALQAAGADMLVLSAGRNVESIWATFGSGLDYKEISEVLGRDWLSRAFLRLAGLRQPRNLAFREMYLLEYSRRIRSDVTLPLGYLGGVKSMANVNQALDCGFEAIVLARAFIHDPELVKKFRRGETQQSACTNCNKCVAYIYHPAGTRCVENAPNDLLLNQVRASA